MRLRPLVVMLGLVLLSGLGDAYAQWDPRWRVSVRLECDATGTTSSSVFLRNSIVYRNSAGYGAYRIDYSSGTQELMVTSGVDEGRRWVQVSAGPYNCSLYGSTYVWNNLQIIWNVGCTTYVWQVNLEYVPVTTYCGTWTGSRDFGTYWMGTCSEAVRPVAQPWTNPWVRLTVSDSGVWRTNLLSVGGVTVGEVVTSNGVAVLTNSLERRLSDAIGSAAASSAVGVAVGSGVVGGVGGGTGAVSVTVTGVWTVDVTQAVAYSRSELPGGTNWSWVIGAAEGAATEAFGSVGSGPQPPQGGGGVSDAAWQIPLHLASGGVHHMTITLGPWLGSGLASWVKGVLEVVVLICFALLIHGQVSEDLRSAWSAPQGRTAGQTVMGTGMQAASALAAAAVVVTVLVSLGAAMVAWAWGGFSWLPAALPVRLSLGGLPGGLVAFLQLGPWEVLVGCLQAYLGWAVGRPWWIAATHAAVRFVTGL